MTEGNSPAGTGNAQWTPALDDRELGPMLADQAWTGCRWNEALVGLTGQPQPAPHRGKSDDPLCEATAGSAEQTLKAHLALQGRSVPSLGHSPPSS
jgi:transposase